MYRRIEFIHEPGRALWTALKDFTPYKSGIMGASSLDVADAWIDHLRGPWRSIPQNSRFYFTEKGWREVGRHVAAACRRTDQRYRVICVKHNAVDVCWRDKHTGLEVAAQPLPKKHRASQRRMDHDFHTS